MRAAVMVGPKAPLLIEELEPLELADRDVVVEVRASGLCHSDLLPLQGLGPDRSPAVLGHEGAGVITAVGNAVTRVAVGDTVIASWVASCGICYWCTHGQRNLCAEHWDGQLPTRLRRSDGTPVNTAQGLGTFAEEMVVGECAVVPVPTELPFEQLALIGCSVMTGVGAALNTAQVVPGSSVVVLGCGGVGTSAIQGARIAGATQIICVDPVPLKRDMAQAVGATDAIDPSGEDAVEQVRELTGGRGADYGFETAGRTDTAGLGFEMIRRGGTLVMVGAQPPAAPLPWLAFLQMFQEKRVLGSLYGSAQIDRDFPRVVRMAERGMLKLEQMVSRKLTLDEVNEGLDAIGRGEVIRSVIVN